MSAPRLLVRTACAPRMIIPQHCLQSPRYILKFTSPSTKALSTTTTFKMPESLKKSEVDAKQDPSVSKQYDNEAPKDQQIKQFFDMVDGKKIGMLSTHRNGVGLCP